MNHNNLNHDELMHYAELGCIEGLSPEIASRFRNIEIDRDEMEDSRDAAWENMRVISTKLGDMKDVMGELEISVKDILQRIEEIVDYAESL
jgi:hypothetical protein